MLTLRTMKTASFNSRKGSNLSLGQESTRHQEEAEKKELFEKMEQAVSKERQFDPERHRVRMLNRITRYALEKCVDQKRVIY
jgi:hypothetical protein